MPRFKLTLTYEYDANPEFYFDEVPGTLTQDHINEMLEIDSSEGNIHDFLQTVVESGEYSIDLREVVE